MSSKDKEILDKIAKLPEPLQDKFLDRLQGATMAMDIMQKGGNDGKHMEADAPDAGGH